MTKKHLFLLNDAKQEARKIYQQLISCGVNRASIYDKAIQCSDSQDPYCPFGRLHFMIANKEL